MGYDIKKTNIFLHSGHYFHFFYGTNKPGIHTASGGTGGDYYSQSNSLYGDSTASGAPTGKWYGGEDYSFTRNYVSASMIGYTTAACAYQDIEYDTDLSAAFAAGAIYKVVIPHSSFSAAATAGSQSIDTTQPEAVLLASTSGSTVLLAQYPRFTKYNSSTGNWTFIVSGSTLSGGKCQIEHVEYIKATTEDKHTDFETGQTAVGTIPELKIQIRRDNVNA